MSAAAAPLGGRERELVGWKENACCVGESGGRASRHSLSQLLLEREREEGGERERGRQREVDREGE